MIAVTCRNGEHFTIDPAEIERAEAVPDTVLHMVGGRTYVLAMTLDELLRAIRDSHAELVVAQRRMGEGIAHLLATLPDASTQRCPGRPDASSCSRSSACRSKAPSTRSRRGIGP